MNKFAQKFVNYFIRKKIALENALDKRKNPYNFVNELLSHSRNRAEPGSVSCWRN